MTRASGGNLARTQWLQPLLFTRSAMGFLMTTESQDLGLTSHPKDSAFYCIQGSYTFLPTNFHDFSMTFVTISMT